MEFAADLVYDVGANNGDDTAYYLFKGYRVLAIEADPTLMPLLRERFSAEIAKGRLALLNVALAPERKRAPFWICEGYSLWNSFDREIASRLGHKCHAVELECWPLRDIFSKHGVPSYLKLSLHGQEHFCLTDIKPEVSPTFVSLELPRDLMTSEEILARLMTLGYDSFKIIDQTTQKQLVFWPPTLKGRLRQKLQQYSPLYDIYESITHWGRRLITFRQQPSAKDSSSTGELPGRWVFPEGSSGPFGEETDGDWQKDDEVRAAWKAFISSETDQGPPNLSVWHDLHATRMKSRSNSAS